MTQIQWLPAAKQDLQRLYEFILPHSEDAAVRAIQTLVAAVDGLAEFPEMGRPWEADLDYRELSVRFGAKGYVLRYRIEGGNVVIVRVWHAREDR